MLTTGALDIIGGDVDASSPFLSSVSMVVRVNKLCPSTDISRMANKGRLKSCLCNSGGGNHISSK